MDIEFQNALEENDKEYDEGLIPFANKVHHILDIPPTNYNPPQFQTNIIIIINNLKIIKFLEILIYVQNMENQ